MFKVKGGSITNPKTGATKDIIVNSIKTNEFGDMLIGGGIVLIGIAYLTSTAFKRGARVFEETELQALSALGLLDQDK